MSVNSIIDSEVVDIHGSLSLVLKGEDGESAYEVAVRNGFVGTEEEWLNSLKGEADRAEAATAEALVWRNSAKDYAVEAGNHEEAAKGYRNECQTIKDGIAPQVTQAISAIQAEKAEAEAKKALVDEAAAQAHLDRVQADADAAEVRYLHGETVEQKNIATDAAERARRYAAREFNWEDLNERPTTRDDFPILDVPKVDGTDATGTWDIDITGDAATVNGHTVAKNVPANAVFTDTTYSEATTSQAGLLSATDKAKLNGIESGAQANTITGVKGSAESSYRIGNVNITKANIGLGNVDNTADIDKSVASAQTANNVAWSGVTNKPTTLEGYGITNAPTKTGTGASGTWGIDINGNAETVNGLTVETAVPANAEFTDTTYDVMTSSELSDGTSTQGKLIDAHTLATFILTVAADVVNNAPEALDTLAELAQALGDDPNFSTTVMNEIGKKLDKSGGVITGNLTVNGTLTGNASTATKATGDKNGKDITTTYLKLTGGTLSNALRIVSTGGYKLTLCKEGLTGKDTLPTVTQDHSIGFNTANVDAADSANCVGKLGASVFASGLVRMWLRGYRYSLENPDDVEMGVEVPLNGEGYAYAPTYSVTTDNSNKIATTNWIRTATGNTNLNAATATKATGDKNGDDITNTYLKKTGGTLTGQLKNSGETAYKIVLADQNLADKSTLPSSWKNQTIGFTTAPGNASISSGTISNITSTVRDTGLTTFRLTAYRFDSTNSDGVTLSLEMPKTGEGYITAPTPSNTNDNNNKIATTAWVRTATGNTNLNAATATKATYDENGVRISTSYAPQVQIDYLANVATNSVSAAVSAKNDAVTAKNQAQNIADGLVSIRDTAVDTSLAISGQAADSKTVGDKFAVIGATSATNNEYLCVWLDSANRVLFGVKADGSFYWQKGIPKVLKDELDGIKARLSALEG